MYNLSFSRLFFTSKAVMAMLMVVQSNDDGDLYISKIASALKCA